MGSGNPRVGEDKIRDKITGTCVFSRCSEWFFYFHYFFNVAPTNRVKSEGKWHLQFEKEGAKSQSSKNEGKITIRLRNRGRNTKVPKKN